MSDLTGKVLVTGTSVSDALLEPLRKAGLTVANPTHLLSPDELADALKGTDAYLLGGEEYATAPSLAYADDLKIIAFLGVGYESFIDVPAATKRGVIVTNTPGTLTDSVAEFTMGMALNATRRIAEYAATYREGARGTEDKQHDLSAMSVGIIGLGNIGLRLAELLRAFGSSVSYYSRTRKPDAESRLSLNFLELNSLLTHSDLLIIMVPGNDSTAGMLNSETLAHLRPNTILINTARREVVEPGALREALTDGRISVAAYDDFYEDPVGRDLLRDFPPRRLIVTGHIASLTHEARDGMAKKAVQSILNILSGERDPYIVNDPTTR